MRQYLVVRTDKSKAAFILRELREGRLRQGWGSKPGHDLRLLAKRVESGVTLTGDETAAWRNRRLLDTDHNGVKPDDLLIVPNIPKDGCWVMARVAGPYRYEMPTSEADYGHLVPVEMICRPNGEVAVVEWHNEHVDARLRASMRNARRMWSVQRHDTKVENLIAAVARGDDTLRAQPEDEKFAKLSEAVAREGDAWELILARYQGAEFEKLVLRVLRHHYRLNGRVAHHGGAGEKGADFIVATQDSLGRELKIAVQVKLHRGADDDVRSLDQIKWARSAHQVDAGVVLTTATSVGAKFEQHQAALIEELGIEIGVVLRPEFLKRFFALLAEDGDS